MPYEVRALDQICYIGSVYPLTAVAALANVKPANQPFRLSVLLDEKDRLELRWSVAPGYFLYRDKVSATLDGKPLKVSTARGDMTIRRLARPRFIIAKPKRTSMARICRSPEKYWSPIKGVEKMPSAIRRSQSRSTSPRTAGCKLNEAVVRSQR